jgi:hypothetical protein
MTPTQINGVWNFAFGSYWAVTPDPQDRRHIDLCLAFGDVGVTGAGDPLLVEGRYFISDANWAEFQRNINPYGNSMAGGDDPAFGSPQIGYPSTPGRGC